MVNHDANGNGINQTSLWSPTAVISMGDLNGDSCGGSGASGVSASYGWAVDDSGKTVVGTAYRDMNGNGICQNSFQDEIVPFVWNKGAGISKLDTSPLTVSKTQYVRAHAISGNGRVILGSDSGQRSVAWVDQGPMINLNQLFGVRDAYASSYDGSKVAFQRYIPTGTGTATKPDEVVIWNPYAPEGTPLREIGGLRWCTDLPYIALGQNRCLTLGTDAVYAQYGTVPLLITDMTDDGSIVIGRAGSASAGYIGVIWIEGVGWLKWNEFFRNQGVPEAYAVGFDNPLAISASGSEVVGGIPGVSFSWWANLDQVFVCENGKSVQVGFPNGLRTKVANGAVIGRCEHL
jgi:hypothetical protein